MEKSLLESLKGIYSIKKNGVLIYKNDLVLVDEVAASNENARAAH